MCGWGFMTIANTTTREEDSCGFRTIANTTTKEEGSWPYTKSCLDSFLAEKLLSRVTVVYLLHYLLLGDNHTRNDWRNNLPWCLCYSVHLSRLLQMWQTMAHDKWENLNNLNNLPFRYRDARNLKRGVLATPYRYGDTFTADAIRFFT